MNRTWQMLFDVVVLAKPTQVARHGSLMSSALKQSNKNIIHIGLRQSKDDRIAGWFSHLRRLTDPPTYRPHRGNNRNTFHVILHHLLPHCAYPLSQYASVILCLDVVFWLDVRSGENWSIVWLFSHLQRCSVPQVGKWPGRCQVVEQPHSSPLSVPQSICD